MISKTKRGRLLSAPCEREWQKILELHTDAGVEECAVVAERAPGTRKPLPIPQSAGQRVYEVAATEIADAVAVGIDKRTNHIRHSTNDIGRGWIMLFMRPLLSPPWNPGGVVMFQSLPNAIFVQLRTEITIA